MISKKINARLKNNVKMFLKEIRIRIVIVIIKNHNSQAFNLLKTLYNVILTNENSNNEKIK